MAINTAIQNHRFISQWLFTLAFLTNATNSTDKTCFLFEVGGINVYFSIQSVFVCFVFFFTSLFLFLFIKPERLNKMIDLLVYENSNLSELLSLALQLFLGPISCFQLNNLIKHIRLDATSLNIGPATETTMAHVLKTR